MIFSNPKDSDRAYAKKKFTQIRRRSVDELAAFVTKNNTAYAGAHRLQEKIDSLDDDSTVPGVCVEDDSANLITEVIHDSSRVNTFSNASIIERSGGMFNLRPPRPFALEDKVENDDADENGDQIRRFQVQNSQMVLGSRSERFYPLSFPGLFPFGYGTPNSPRDVQVSLQQALRHYFLLSDRRFAQDSAFTLVAFDEVARRRAHRSLAVKLRADPNAANEMVSLSSEALNELISYEILATEAARKDRRVPTLRPSTDLKRAKKVVSIIKKSAGKSFGTRDERNEMRTRVTALAIPLDDRI